MLEDGSFRIFDPALVILLERLGKRCETFGMIGGMVNRLNCNSLE